MLKKIVHIMLVLLLMVATTGFTISKQYCGNHLLAVSIFKVEKCSCSGPCKDCHTNNKLIKVSDNFSASEIIHPGAPTSTALLFDYNNELLNFVYTANVTNLFNLKEPPPGEQNLFVLNQSFLC